MPSVREGDDPASEPWKQRRITMHPDGPAVSINGWLGRARVASMILKDVGVSTVVLVFILGWLTGWIPFPLLTTLQDILRKCVQVMTTMPTGGTH